MHAILCGGIFSQDFTGAHLAGFFTPSIRLPCSVRRQYPLALASVAHEKSGRPPLWGFPLSYLSTDFP
jgi:hypothetical protein